MSIHSAIRLLYAAGSSSGSMATCAVIPCFKEFIDERFLPSSVTGPLLFLPFLAFAARLASDTISSSDFRSELLVFEVNGQPGVGPHQRHRSPPKSPY